MSITHKASINRNKYIERHKHNQRVIGVLSLPVDKWLDVRPQITVLRRDIHQQEGLQHHGLSGCQ